MLCRYILSIGRCSLSVLTILIPAGCGQHTKETKPVIQDITESVYASGIVKSKNQYQVYSTVNGVIRDIPVQEGDTVKKDEALIYIQNEASLLNAQNAKLAKSYNDLKANESRIREALAAIDLAFIKMRNDSLLFQRQKNLWLQDIGSKVELEQREISYRNSQTSYRIAQFNYTDLQRQLKFTARQSVNNLKISTSQAGDYIIRARQDGTVYKIFKEPGEYANTVSPLAIIGDTRDFIVELKVDEYDIVRLQKGQPVYISMDSYKGKVFEGRVSAIEPLMNEDSRSFTVEAVFTTVPPALYPNLSVEANIVIRKRDRALTIPRSYLSTDSTVMLANGEHRKVQVGVMDYQQVEILKGLTEEEAIQKP